MSLSRRNALAALAVGGVGVFAAGAKALASSAAEASPLTGATLATGPNPFGGPTPTPTTTAASGAYCLPGQTAAGASASAEAVAPTLGAAVSTPTATRTMPVAGAASASATASASASAASGAARTRMSGAALASGSSCIGAANGAFGNWRGKGVQVASTWSQDGKTWAVDPGGEYGSWKGDLDFAPQYDLGNSFSWGALASGSYDSRLRADLQTLKSRWGNRTSTLYYRFQHEFNGDWYKWSVGGNAGEMRAGWQRFAGVFRSVFGNDPRFRIAWSPNAGSSPKLFKDIRDAWPGDAYVDVIALDYYDFSKPQSTGQWSSQSVSRDSGGGPVGTIAWQQFAQQHGKPLSFSEWGNQYGDNPFFIQAMHTFMQQNAYSGSGSEAGKVIYEVYFNQVFDGSSVSGGGDFRVEVNGSDHSGRPNAARTYRQLFGA
jgi:hypothetical protein